MKKRSIQKALIEGTFFQKSYKKCKKVILNIFNGNYFKRFLKKIDSLLALQVRRIAFRNEPINSRKILFTTFNGAYACNPKAIAEEIIRQRLPWELIWTVKKENKKKISQFPPMIRTVEWGTYNFYREAASAKVWIANSTYLTGLVLEKRPNQVLIQTWHGSLGLKRFETNQDRKWIKVGYKDGKRTDYCISNSTFETELFRNTFWKQSEILEYGHARNDILLHGDLSREEEKKQRIYSKIDVPCGVKIALYAPTFRDSKALTPYSIDYEMLRQSLESKFGGEWIVLCRFHPQIQAAMNREKKHYPKFPEFVKNVTAYEDIQDLLLVADVGITDYSSWICDFVLTRRPGFFFATDLRDYYDERGFYFPLETTPFPLAENNAQLEQNILSFDEDAYRKRCDAFIAEKGCIDDGHAAERIVEKLKEIMGEQQ